MSVKTWETEKTWEVSVTDNGVGFDPEAVRREIENGERDSTGLYNLIFRLENMMGAAVEIQSAPGDGTEVSVHIPKAGNRGNTNGTLTEP